MDKKNEIEERFLCITAGILMAICFIALMCSDGNKGLLDLF